MKRKRKRIEARSKFVKRQHMEEHHQEQPQRLHLKEQQQQRPTQWDPQQQFQQEQKKRNMNKMKQHNLAQRKCLVATASRARSQMLLASSSAATTTTKIKITTPTTTTRTLGPRTRARSRTPEALSIGVVPTTKPPQNHTPNEMDLIKSASRLHLWHWNEDDKSQECIVGEDKLEVCFHPECSESAAAIRGSEPLIRDGNYYYWEVTVFDKTYGTSVMFGLCTKEQSLHANEYCNLIGLDKEGWSLSHKGLTWHNGINQQYTRMFPPNQSITIGLLFNTKLGELSYYMDGKNLGVAFSGLNDVKSELYPVIGSTAKCTRMRLTNACRGYKSLLERSCFILLQHSQDDRTKLIEYLHNFQLPNTLIKYLAEVAQVCDSQTKKTGHQSSQHKLEC